MSYEMYENLDDFLEDKFHFNSTIDLTVKEEDNFIKNHNIPLCNIVSQVLKK